MKAKFMSAVVGALIAVVTLPLVAAGGLSGVSSATTPTPGQWNSNFATSLAYAEANHIPVIMFLGATGCAYANKGIDALEMANVKDWIAAKKPILIFKNPSPKEVSAALRANSAAQAPDPDLYKAIKWVVNGTRVSDYPIFRVYWLQADGKSKTVSFTARNKTMPVNTPAGGDAEAIAQKLVATFNMYVGEYVPGSVGPVVPPVGPVEPPVEPPVGPTLSDFGERKLSYASCLLGADGELVGVLNATASKANRQGVVSVTCKLTLLDGTKVSLSGKTTVDDHELVLKNSRLGAVALTFTDEAVSGTVGGAVVEAGHEIGGELAAGTATFSLVDDVPGEYKDYEIVQDALPAAEPLDVTTRALKAGKAGTVKWVSRDKRLDVSETNPSALKVTYAPSTGLAKVTFKVYGVKYTYNSRTGELTRATVKKYSASGTGLLVDGAVTGVATVKGFGSFGFEIR